ncbi:MAG: hypothetical protein ACQEP1_03565 [Nanobdellota archaeon]
MKSYDHKPESLIGRRHHQYPKEHQRVFYSIAIIVLAVVSFFASISMVPLLIFFDTVWPILLISGFVLGMVFTYMVLDLQHLERRHHLLLGLVVPAIAVIDVLIMVSLGNRVAEHFSMDFSHNPLNIAVFYIAGFLVPYIVAEVRDYRNSLRK